MQSAPQQRLRTKGQKNYTMPDKFVLITATAATRAYHRYRYAYHQYRYRNYTTGTETTLQGNSVLRDKTTVKKTTVKETTATLQFHSCEHSCDSITNRLRNTEHSGSARHYEYASRANHIGKRHAYASSTSAPRIRILSVRYSPHWIEQNPRYALRSTNQAHSVNATESRSSLASKLRNYSEVAPRGWTKPQWLQWIPCKLHAASSEANDMTVNVTRTRR